MAGRTVTPRLMLRLVLVTADAHGPRPAERGHGRIAVAAAARTAIVRACRVSLHVLGAMATLAVPGGCVMSFVAARAVLHRAMLWPALVAVRAGDRDMESVRERQRARAHPRRHARAHLHLALARAWKRGGLVARRAPGGLRRRVVARHAVLTGADLQRTMAAARDVARRTLHAPVQPVREPPATVRRGALGGRHRLLRDRHRDARARVARADPHRRARARHPDRAALSPDLCARDQHTHRHHHGGQDQPGATSPGRSSAPPTPPRRHPPPQLLHQIRPRPATARASFTIRLATAAARHTTTRAPTDRVRSIRSLPRRGYLRLLVRRRSLGPPGGGVGRAVTLATAGPTAAPAETSAHARKSGRTRRGGGGLSSQECVVRWGLFGTARAMAAPICRRFGRPDRS